MVIKAGKQKEQLGKIPPITIENAKIFARNFAGKAGTYNAEGQRNFCVYLDHDVAEEFVRLGFNVKYLKPRDEQEEQQAFVQVKVQYGDIPPRIVVVTSKNKTTLNENTVSRLDWAEIEMVDLIINPYRWEARGAVGVKPYVKTMYVTLVEDNLSEKYSNVPDSAISSPEDDDR
jgi:hypothetical protein